MKYEADREIEWTREKTPEDYDYRFKTTLEITFGADGWMEAQHQLDMWKNGIEYAGRVENAWFRSLQNLGAVESSEADGDEDDGDEGND